MSLGGMYTDLSSGPSPEGFFYMKVEDSEYTYYLKCCWCGYPYVRSLPVNVYGDNVTPSNVGRWSWISHSPNDESSANSSWGRGSHIPNDESSANSSWGRGSHIPNDESSANSSRTRHHDMRDARNFAIERAAECNRSLGPCHCKCPQRHPEGSGEEIY
ncbi:hypothetical protein CEXT_706351 [Caerostris extrusa]|uniref:Uncharacterized protein n=1 Tax=Caerostris extrusa TaxID=172846 RepID=A0AAV4NNT7_CAEEX|nr:hypothetical protein CEXT_706351 [Caerostris extrusa]